jgi:hypothetical protein
MPAGPVLYISRNIWGPISGFHPRIEDLGARTGRPPPPQAGGGGSLLGAISRKRKALARSGKTERTFV